LQLLRQAQGCEVRHRSWDHSHHHCTAATLNEDVDTEARHSRQAIGDITGSLFPQHGDGLLVIADQIGSYVTRVVGAQQSQPGCLHRDQVPMDAHLGRTSRGENQVADLAGCTKHGHQQGIGGDRARLG